MKFLVFDLEATCWDINPQQHRSEIIEIGACIVNPYGEIEKTFSKFIKPVLNPTLSVYCRHLTSIQQSDVDVAKSFPKVFDEFMEWAEIPDQDYVFCAWGSKDLMMIESDSDIHRYDVSWFRPYVDVKSQYHSRRNISKTNGLAKTLKLLNLEFEGEVHRALSDAYNLSKIIVRYIDEWSY
jgi:inhibitor of KinA sporulation pathway (predicted exonuclease)